MTDIQQDSRVDCRLAPGNCWKLNRWRRDGAAHQSTSWGWLQHLAMTCAKKKHFSTATEDEGSMTQECLQEVSVLAQLNHPHIVKLLCMNVHPVSIHVKIAVFSFAIESPSLALLSKSSINVTY